jgi:hypothetical protein
MTQKSLSTLLYILLELLVVVKAVYFNNKTVCFLKCDDGFRNSLSVLFGFTHRVGILGQFRGIKRFELLEFFKALQ